MNRRRLVIGAFAAGMTSVVMGASAFACTLYEGTFSVCDDQTSACVTATGTGMMTNTVSGSTTLESPSANVTVSGSGLIANGTEYVISYLAPSANVMAHECQGAGVPIGTASTDGNGGFSNVPVTVPTAGDAGPGVICTHDVQKRDGNEVPVTVAGL